MYDKYFSQYIGDINNILDKKASSKQKSYRNFSLEKSNKDLENGHINESVRLDSPNELRNLFGTATGYKESPTIGTHPDFANLIIGNSIYQYCVSMFIDIKGSTNLALKYTLDEVRQMKDAVLSLCIYATTFFGGHIQRL